MRRWHFYVMGTIAVVYGVLAAGEYLLLTFGQGLGRLDIGPEGVVPWLTAMPGWVQWVWIAHVLLALVGGLCLAAHLRASVWMLAFAFLTLAIFYVWAAIFAEPGLVALVGGGWTIWATMGLILVLSLLIYLYARGEKRAGEVL